ncbi:KdsC family phosphatase [Occallatibacter riparius]|uniref:HAD hydrolase family protein n=1 Tax=Occallatibacter riparius TaxID=1002689 RepID=A0A9J7BIZ4_9BACT|nr:HAD hydrolase family protein [Occallatibacter riparius]UWZ81762.1 HAD hydrolase family protein [Occallatibacter riparius]
MSLTATERARRIKIIIFDVDGVLTDGTIWLVPAPGGTSAKVDQHMASADGVGFGVSSATMMEAKGYSAHDGAGISLARIGGLKCGVITKRISETVATRMRDLKMDYVYMGQAFKMRPIREIMEKEGVTLEEIAYVGDDVIDLPVMRQVGFAVAVENAREQVKAEAHYVTKHAGGYGGGRDAVDFILDAKGILNNCIETMIDESNPISPSMDIGNGVERA